MAGPTLLDCAIAYAATVNVMAFTVYAADKRRAVAGRQRISEATLLWFARIGGSIGAVLAQQLLRHKTRKEPFRSRLLHIVIVQAVLVGLMCIEPVRSAALRFVPLLALAPPTLA